MVYDNTKFHAAFDKWLEQNVEVGYGEHYGGELLADFEEFLRETKMLKRSPGRVVFGVRLGEKGFEKRKVRGLTYWYGLELKTRRNIDPIRFAQQSTKQRIRDAEFEQRMAKRDEMLRKSPDTRKDELEQWREELEEEERRLRELENAKPY